MINRLVITPICAQNRDVREGLDSTGATTESFQHDLLPSDLLISRDVAVVLDGMLDDVEELEKEPEPEPVADEEVRTFWIEEVVIAEKLQKPQELKATATTSCKTLPDPSDLLMARDVAVVMDQIVEDLEKPEEPEEGE